MEVIHPDFDETYTIDRALKMMNFHINFICRKTRFDTKNLIWKSKIFVICAHQFPGDDLSHDLVAARDI